MVFECRYASVRAVSFVCIITKMLVYTHTVDFSLLLCSQLPPEYDRASWQERRSVLCVCVCVCVSAHPTPTPPIKKTSWVTFSVWVKSKLMHNLWWCAELLAQLQRARLRRILSIISWRAHSKLSHIQGRGDGKVHLLLLESSKLVHLSGSLFRINKSKLLVYEASSYSCMRLKVLLCAASSKQVHRVAHQ